MPFSLLRSLRLPAFFLVLLLAGAASQAKTFSGLIYPLHDITMSAGVAGLVMKRLVVPGQYVKADEELLLLDDRLQVIESERRKKIFEDQSEVIAAKDRLAILTTLLKAARAVYQETGSVSQDELLRLQAEHVAAVGRWEQLVIQKQREKLDFETAERERLQRHITAPITGIVTKIIPQVGEWAKPGDPIILLVDASSAVLRLAIPHKDIGDLKLGTTRTIAFEAGASAKQTTARVTFISPVADPASGLVEVWLTFANTKPTIKPGIKGSMDIGPGN